LNRNAKSNLFLGSIQNEKIKFRWTTSWIKRLGTVEFGLCFYSKIFFWLVGHCWTRTLSSIRVFSCFCFCHSRFWKTI